MRHLRSIVLTAALISVVCGQAIAAEPPRIELIHERLGDDDGTIGRWDRQNRVATEAVEFSPDEQYFATVSKSTISGRATVKLWRTDTAETVWSMETGEETEAVTFSQDGKWIVSGGETGLRIWRSEDGEAMRHLPYEASVEGLRFSPDGTRLATGDEASKVRIWDTSHDDPGKWGLERSILLRDGKGVADVNQVDWTRDGAFIATAQRDGDVELLSADTDEIVRRFEGFSASVKSVRLSPDERWIAAGCSGEQGVRVWDFETGEPVAHFDAPAISAERFEAVEFTNDSRFLIVGGTWPRSPELIPVPLTVFAMDGDFEKVAEIDSWRTEYIDFSPDGSRMVTGHDDGSVRVWSVAAGPGEPVAIFTGGEHGYHTYRIPALVVTPSGTALAFCEGRKTSHEDTGDLDLLMKRSTDGGITWPAEPRILHEEGGDAPITIGNPVPIVDPSSGRVHLLFTKDYTWAHPFWRKTLVEDPAGRAIESVPGVWNAPRLSAADWNGDGQVDLVIGYERLDQLLPESEKSLGGNRLAGFRDRSIYNTDIGEVAWLENVTSDPGRPVFEKARRLEADGAPIQSYFHPEPCVLDWDRNGTPDLLVGGEDTLTPPGETAE